ncbi:MAG: hypothetical protein ABII23_02180 [bacterium]
MKFDFKNLLIESKQTLLSPKTYFSAMPKTGGYAEPVIKTLIYSFLSGCIIFIWSILGVDSASGLGKSAIIKHPVLALVFLFVIALLLLIISLICGGDKSYETNLRVQASMFVLMPISALISVLYGVNPYIGIFISIVLNLFALWIFFNALIYGLSAKPLRAKIVVGIFTAGFIVLFVLAIIALRFTEKFTGTMMNKGILTPEDIQEMKQNPEEAQQKIQELMQQYMQEYNKAKK